MAEADPRGSADHPSRDIILYLFLSLVRMLYLLYAIYIVLFTPYWQPGCMLLFLSAMPQLAVAFRIDGLTEKDRTTGLVYPTRLFQAVMSGFVLFILGQFALGTTVYL